MSEDGSILDRISVISLSEIVGLLASISSTMVVVVKVQDRDLAPTCYIGTEPEEQSGSFFSLTDSYTAIIYKKQCTRLIARQKRGCHIQLIEMGVVRNH